MTCTPASRRERILKWFLQHVLIGSMWQRKLWLGVVVVRALLLAPTPLTAGPPEEEAQPNLSMESLLSEKQTCSPEI